MKNILISLAKNHKNLVVLSTDAVICGNCDEFTKYFPDRAFSCGLAEANMIGCAAGFALAGKLPLVIGNAEFLLSRAFDQIYNDICLPNLNVKILAIGKAGIDRDLAALIPNLPIKNADGRAVFDELVGEYGPAYITMEKF